ncbi:A disintegrin and metalloproteinase with thrombospondin motifs 6-like, partial [Corticium candelabrum]|uniref:A disintegrin and metalloproteinase with thrombospondin motifs 6-like n=1 Tax=Corticium candelabrum TaxID=121492 RepID=UPI002E263D93
MVAVQLQQPDKMNGLIAYGHRSYLIEPASDERYHLLKPLPAQTKHDNGCPLTISKTTPMTAKCFLSLIFSAGSRKQFIKVDDANRSLSERRRRSVIRSIQRFIETTVVIDQSMMDFHGNQTVSYVMSIMNMVHKLFRDQSIGHAIDIVVSQIDILNKTNLMNLTGEANKDLNTFCQWKHQKGNGRHTGEDLSILLTRNDLCVPNHETSCQETWGLAYVGGAC